MFDKNISRKNFKWDFIAGAELIGQYGLPKLKATKAMPYNVIPFNNMLTEREPEDKWLHFYIDDYQFERIWNYPERYINILKKFKGIITPDFSMYDYMPKAQIIWNCFRNRAIAYWMQINGIDIVPSIEWSCYNDLEWCLEGLPLNGVFSIGTYGCHKNKTTAYGLIKGVEKICQELKPAALVLYGNEIKSINSLCKNVIWIENYCKLMKKRL